MRNKKGQVLVETAIVLPLMLVFIFGLVDFARVIYTKNTLCHAARSGARAAAVTLNLTPRLSAPLSADADKVLEPEKTIIKNMFNVIQPNSVTYKLEITPSPSGTAQAGNQVNVLLTKPDFQMITPLYKILALITNSATQDSNTVKITGEASMRYE